MKDCIVIDPNVRHGKPVIRDTRTPISRILGSLAGGMTEEDIMREYDLTREDLQAVCAGETPLEEDVLRRLVG